MIPSDLCSFLFSLGIVQSQCALQYYSASISQSFDNVFESLLLVYCFSDFCSTSNAYTHKFSIQFDCMLKICIFSFQKWKNKRKKIVVEMYVWVWMFLFVSTYAAHNVIVKIVAWYDFFLLEVLLCAEGKRPLLRNRQQQRQHTDYD